ncbi:MAG TPA: hypothetical protein VJU80_03410 [Solirubrobacteraceae bacterium]|nr:hypothetical protein [Solirubrobacteraceae bacterium]
MNEPDVNAAVTMWREQGAPDLPWKDVERALRRLPEAGICAVSDDASSLFMLGPTNALFTVFVDGEEVTLTSRPLDADRLTVSLRWSGEGSRWSFRYVGEPEASERWQDISGSVAIDGTGSEQLDDREQFARALAGRAGWASASQEPPAAEPGSASAPEEAGEDVPRWRAQTDIWGRPLDVRRR